MAMNKKKIVLGKHFAEIYTENREVIHSHATPLMNKCRQEALALLEKTGLPVQGEEEFKRFAIDEILGGEYNFNFERKSYGVDPFRDFPCSLSYTKSVQHFVLDDRVYQNGDAGCEGVFLGSIHDFESKYPQVAQRYYNSNADLRKDPLAQLNTLFVQDAFVIYIPKGVEVSKPIQIINLSGISPDLLCFPRFLLIAEEYAHAKVLLCDHQAYEYSCLSNIVMEIYAEKGACVECYDIEESRAETMRIASVYTYQESESKVLFDSLTIQNGRTRNSFYANLVGRHASFDLDGMCILDGDQIADNYVSVKHSSSDCHSDQLFKYVGNDRSVGSFTGHIYVAPEGQKTEAYQINRNLLLAPTAKMYSKPQLEIYTDDVRCSHGMTTGQIDETALFYMQQRGIPYAEARLMLTISFMSDVLETIRLPELKDRLTRVVDRRFRGLPAGCLHLDS